MKNICFIAILLITAFLRACANPITYGNNTVSKDEFLRAYNKNKTPVTDKEKALRDYLELYTNFKLKVKAAQELRMDTFTAVENRYRKLSQAGR